MTIHDHHYHHHHQQHYHSSLPSSSATLHARHTAIATKTTAQLKAIIKALIAQVPTFIATVILMQYQPMNRRKEVCAIV